MQPKDLPKTSKPVATTANNPSVAQDSTPTQAALHPDISTQNPAALLLNTPAIATAPKRLAKKAARPTADDTPDSDSMVNSDTSLPAENPNQELVSEVSLNPTWQLAAAETALGTATEASALPGAQAATTAAAATETSALAAVVSTTVPSGVLAAAGVVGVASAAGGSSSSTPTNQAPVVSAALTASANEGDTSTTIDLLSGASDANNDTLSVSNITYKVGNGSASSTLPNGLSLSDNTLSLDPTSSAFDSLATGEKQTIVVSYTISDGQGGSVAQTATFTITGTNDVPVVSVTDVIGGVTELTNTATGTLTDSGVITFSDVDLTDTHTISATAVGSVLGTLTATKTSDTTGTGTGGTLSWSYTVADSAVEYLAEGQTKVEQFNITISDGQGGSVVRTVSVTITGTNDSPVAVATSDQTGVINEAISFTASAFTDADSSDTLTYTATLSDGSALPSWLTFDASTRTFSGTPPTGTTAETLSLKVTATDKAHATASTSIDLVLQAEPTIAISGSGTAGTAAAGLLVEAVNSAGTVIASTTTDSTGHYTLNIAASYKGQALVLRVSDPDPSDGVGYTDEATGQSKDFGSALRTTLVLGTADEQTAQITPLTELATRKILNGSDTLAAVDTSTIASTNTAIGTLFGVKDIVGGSAPDVVGGETSDDYGKALALFSGMDAVNDRSGAENPMDATLSKLENAITISGGVDAQFSSADVETLSLLSQGVAEVQTLYSSDTTLIDALTSVAKDAAATAKEDSQTTVFITTKANLIGSGKTTTVTFTFDAEPSEDVLTALSAQLSVTGGSVSSLTQDSSDPTKYTATFTQSGSDTPGISITSANGDYSFFANDVSITLDNTAPTLSTLQIQGYDSTTGAIKTGALTTGDVVRVTLSASESVLVDGTPSLSLLVGTQTVTASYSSTLSSTSNLVFTYTIGSTDNAAEGVSVSSISGSSSITDIAGNALKTTLLPMASSLPVVVDTTAPNVVSEIPSDGSTVGGTQTLTLSFSEAVQRGTGNIVVKKGDATVATLSASDTSRVTIDATGTTATLTLPSTLGTGDYTVEVTSTAFKDSAGNTMTALASSLGSVWNFTVGAVKASIDTISGNNLINATEASNSMAITGSLTGDSALLSTLSASDLTLTLKPVAGGNTLIVSGIALNSDHTWSYTLPANSLSTAGGYIVNLAVNHTQDGSTVQASASRAIVLDTSTSLTLGKVAGDDIVSALERKVVDSSSTKTIDMALVAEKGASVSVTIITDTGQSVTKTIASAQGSGLDKISLSSADLTNLDGGTATLTATSTDLAGNITEATKTFLLAGGTAPAIGSMALSGTPSGESSSYRAGDTLTATVTFDQALTVSGKSATLALDVGGTTRLARYSGISVDGKTLSFSYTVQAGDSDSDGVSVKTSSSSAYTPLSLNGSTLRNATGTDASLTLGSITASNTSLVDAAASTPTLTASAATGNEDSAIALNLSAALTDTDGSETLSSITLSGIPTGAVLKSGSATFTVTNGSALVPVASLEGLTLTPPSNYNGSISLTASVTSTESGGSTATSTKTVLITVNAVNDAPTVQYELTTANAVSGQALSWSLPSNTFADVDNASLTYSAKLADGSSLPSWLSINSSTGALTGTPSATDAAVLSVLIQATDAGGLSASSTLTLQVLAASAPQPVADSASATEAGGINNATAAVLATGSVLSNDVGTSLVVSGAKAATSTTLTTVDAASTLTLQGLYGSLTISADGSYTYTPNDSSAAVQALAVGQSLRDVFSYQVTGGDGQTALSALTITLNGANDAAVISGTSTASLTESNAFQTISGTLTSTDVDGTANLFTAQSGVKGSNGYGSFSITSGGVWKYTMNSAHNEFVAGTTYTDTATVAAADGTTQVLAVTITGTNDAAVISGTKTASLTETNAALSTSGTLTSTDVDGTASLFTAQTGVAGSYGSFSITSGGVWTYTMNSAHNEFVAGTTYTDTTTVTAADGTTQVLTVTITGTNDAPVLTIAASTRIIDEDLNNTGRYIAHNGSASDLGVVNAVAGLEQLSLTDIDTANFGGDTLKVSITSGGTTQLFMGVSNASGMFSVDSSGYIHYYSDATYDGNTGFNVTPHTASNTDADIVVGAVDSTYKGLHGDALWIHLYDTATPAITQALASKIYLSVRNTSDASVTQDWSSAAGTKTIQFELDDSSGSALVSAQRTVNVVSHADLTGVGAVAGTYTTGDTITITLTTDEAVYVDTTNGTPQCQLRIGDTTQYATYTGGSGSKQLTFTYVVEAGLSDSDGIQVMATPLVDNGAIVTDSSGSSVLGSNGYTNIASFMNVLVTSSAGTAPVVNFVSLDSTQTSFFTPDDTIYINVGFDQAVVVSGTPQLQLTLTDASGTNHTVYATCQTSTGSGGATVLSFAYTYAAADTDNLGGQFHIVGLSTANGSTITSASGSVAADLTLHSVTPTADYWLYNDPIVGSTGTSGNDLLVPWFSGVTTAPTSLSGSSITGGDGERDTLAVSIFLPSSVTTAAEASQYSLGYLSATHTVPLLKSGSIVSGYTYTVPAAASDWPDGVESLVYHLLYKDSNGEVQYVSNSARQLWKSVQTFTDAVNTDDIVVQGTYLNDTIDLSSYNSTQRVTVKAGTGDDTITGHSGIDIVVGQGGNDTISTGAGNDKILMGSGTDTIDGGTGTDTLVVQLHGAQARAANASATNQSFDLQSANGSWVNGVFVANASGYTSDYTFSFSEVTGKVSVVADSASGLSGTSSVTGIEALEMRFTNNNERANALVNIGTTDADTLTADGVVWARAGNDTINVVGDSVVFAGDGNDTVVLASADLFDSTDISYFVGGSGIDTLKLSDSAAPTTPSGNWGINTQQFEIWDITDAGSNTLKFSAQHVLGQGNTSTDIWGSLAGYSGMQQFMVKGDSVDTVAFTDTGWVDSNATTTVDGTVFKVWTNSTSGVQLLTQSGMSVTGAATQSIAIGTPVVSFVGLPLGYTTFFTPDDTIYINVGFDQAVVVSGTPQLEFTLTDANGTNHTVYATCQTTTGSSGSTVLSFAYTYAAADTDNLGGQYHIVGLSTASGSTITSANGSVAADLTLHSVSATADFWLYAPTNGSSTGTDGNDLLAPWTYSDTAAPKSLAGQSISGGTDTGSNQRDTLAISILLPDSVTTAADAAQYSLGYASSGSGASVTRYVSLLKDGSIVSGYTYTVPSTTSDWPDGIESLVYHLTYKDSNSEVQFADHSAVQLWKSVETFTDAVNTNDIVVQGSYLNDTIDLSSYTSDQRVTVKAGFGNDIITGHSGTDIVLGQGGNDTISTGAGNDKILIGSGTDTIDGGTGTDTLAVQLHGAESRAFNASATNQSFDLQSANGSWVNGAFVTDASGYTSDYTFSFSEATGKVSVVADSGSGLSGTSSVTGVEQLEVRFTNNNERDSALLTIGSTDADTLTANGVVWARAGNDTINVVGDSVVFAGDGNDTVILASTDLFDFTNISYFAGGSGIDTLKLSDSAVPTTPGGNWGINTQQFEIFDMTGAGSNTFTLSTSFLRNQDNTDKDIWGSLAGYSGMQQFMAKGDAVDTVSFLNTGWEKASTTTTVDSVVFDIWTNSNSSVQLLLQSGIQTTTVI
ncbi:S-layer family protein [Limnohabitans sp. JirII-31]|uniref:beta strand repeat-containing protein n=1 Tax=Limnohabitans sp. JirII-31 TaxID=1977908 RepID=UPI000C1F19CD|nr:VCBS domain-containing protein [Limnohabitans sp. JirII-31]PIT79768.1 hypothetical protein B9Z41_04085 [Limnohabitans sp. JirII-31]